MIDPRSVIELVRAPAALSVPGDTLAGAAAAGWPFGTASAALPVASACLYWAGMALNDYVDRDIDAAERPGRPIPSGRVDSFFALGLASGLTIAGLGVAAAAGGRDALAVAVPLAATVWAYDLGLKETPAGPAAMATARSLDVLLGAGAARARAAGPASLILGAHTVTVTTLSRSEVSGAKPRLPKRALAATAGVAAATACRAARRIPVSEPGRAAGTLARLRDTATRLVGTAIPLAVYGVTSGHAQLEAVREPSPERLQRAVGAGILGMMPLQSALTAGATPANPSAVDSVATGGNALQQIGAAAAVLAAFPLARRLSRRVSAT